MTCTTLPRHIAVTHRGSTRWIRATGRREQLYNSVTTISHSLTQSSISTTFLRQLELFSGRSISELGMENDRNIQRLADGINNLEGISNNFDHVADSFQNEGRELFIESVDFDKGLLCIVEIKKKTMSQQWTVEEMWKMVIQKTATTGVSSNGNIASMLDSLFDNNGHEIETMKKSSKLSAATVGDDPKCKMPFTLLEDFNINSLDYLDLNHRNFAVEDGNSNALTGFIVTNSDMKPTEERNCNVMKYVSNPKDESQENMKLNTIGNRLGTRKNIHILNNSEMSGSSAILANYSLLQQYDKIKDTIRTPGRAQYKLQNLISKEKVQENDKRAEIFQQLDAEWIIKLKSEIISLSAEDNDTLNHKAVQDMEGFRTRTTVISLTIKGKKRNCRIVPIKKDDVLRQLKI